MFMSVQPFKTHQHSEGFSFDCHNMKIVMRLKLFKSFTVTPRRSLHLILMALHLLASPVKTQWHVTLDS